MFSPTKVTGATTSGYSISFASWIDKPVDLFFVLGHNSPPSALWQRFIRKIQVMWFCLDIRPADPWFHYILFIFFSPFSIYLMTIDMVHGDMTVPRNKTMLLKDVRKGIRFLLIKYTNQSMRNRYVDDRHSKQFLTTRYQPLLMMFDVPGQPTVIVKYTYRVSLRWVAAVADHWSKFTPWLYRAIFRYLRLSLPPQRWFHILIAVREEIANDNWGNGQMPSWHWVQGRSSININPWSTYASIYGYTISYTLRIVPYGSPFWA